LRMPPRRSTRSRASVEPPTTAASKRKRPSPDENEVPEDIKPTSRVSKPSSTRSSTAPSGKSRASTRARKSLEDVQESEEEWDKEDSPPPVKKSRPSLSKADEEDEDEYEEVKPSRLRRAPPRKTPSAGGRKGKAVAPKQESDDEVMPSGSASEEEEAKPKARARKAGVKKEPVDVSDDEEDEEQFRPKPALRGRKSASVRVSEPPSRRGRPSASSKGKTPASTRGKRGVKKVEEEEEAEEEEEPEPHQVTSNSRIEERKPDGNESDALSYAEAPQITIEPSSSRLPAVDEEEVEEEHSLLEHDVVVPMTPQPKAHIQATIVEEPQGPKARLVIHKMALVNFKSYAGRQEIGPFHKSFSAIVGPNGSGKSNTIDALLFVFGYRASKMRQGKLSELIHNSARYPDLDECSVEVHFREIVDMPGPDAFEVIPNSSLVVARTAYKNNSSKYTINGRQSNYKEVQALLKGRGIDLDHNRFLILQGEVESIAQMKPKAPSEHEDGLLEYLEDIIGTSRYKEPIEEALVEMEKYSEERMEKLNRLKIVERERNALEKQKKEAEDYLRLQNEHVRALSRLWQWYLWKCLLNEEEFTKNMDRIERELKEETERNKDDITHLEALEKHYKERCAAYEEVKAAAAEAVKDLASHEKQQVSLEERRKHAKSKAKKLHKSLHDDEHNQAEASRSIEDNTAKMEREKKKVDEFEASLAKEEKVLEEIRDSLKDKTQVFHDQIEAKQKEMQPWTAQINAKQAEIDVATSERDTLVKKAEVARQARQDAQDSLAKLRTDHEAKITELDELKASRTGKLQEVKDGQKRFQDARAQVDNLRSKASAARQKTEEAKQSQASNTSQNKVLDSLTRLRSAGRIDGFHGRLGSLGTIPDKYDVAVSTACGALNNLVVNTVEQGQACIEYLRKQNVGRASFLVLQKLSPQGLDKISTPENVPRLFDLMKPKESQFAPAFFKAVGNTLVADDLEQANRIAFGGQRRWRVVTLAGQLIDSSGTMSGGGNHVARGGMSSKLAADAVSPETLRKYEQDSASAERELDAAVHELREAEGALEALSQSGPQLDIAIEKIGLDIQTGTRRIAEAQKRVQDLKAQNKPDSGDAARISELEAEIAAATEELEELQERTAAIEQEIKALEKKILDIGGARLLSQKSKVDGIRLHINLANDEITKAEVAKAKAEKDVAKLKSAIDTNRASLEEVDNEVEDLTQKLDEVTQYVDEIREEVQRAQAAAENSKEDLDTLKEDLDEKNQAIQAFRQKEMELKQALSDTQKEAAENERSLQYWQAEHDKLRLEDVDDEDEEEEEAKDDNAEAQPTEEPAEGDSVKPEPKEPKLKKGRPPPDELHIYSAEELSTFKKREMIADAELLDEKLKSAKPNMSVLKDYRKREEEFLRRAQDLENVTQLRDAQKQTYEGLRKQRLDEFMTGFSAISLKLKEMYQMITLGGNAELELVDSMDPFSEGIIFSVMPPKKSWRNISNLSGGEKLYSSWVVIQE
ncbi:hypothetical protein PHLCEN_2v12066, partial [Hermanssonia centrifuga]